jgi:hypothetical protein
MKKGFEIRQACFAWDCSNKEYLSISSSMKELGPRRMIDAVRLVLQPCMKMDRTHVSK